MTDDRVVIGGKAKLRNVVKGNTSLRNVLNGSPGVTLGGGMSPAVKEALLDCFEHVAWVDDDGQVYYQALYDALYPKVLASITAVFNQGQAVIYDTDTLDDLTQYLTVTATYDDSSTATIASTDYTLSGTLTPGASTITVTYKGKTTTFNVTVTHMAGTVTITNTLTGCTTSNAAASGTEGASYSATITASSGYSLTGASVSITMGGVDITASAYTNGTISIAELTGNLVITITAVAVTLASISAVYTQSGTVYEDTALNDLKTDLVVTATYSDSSTAIIPSTDYTLSGTLTEGTSTVTVTYDGKTTTFSVTVSASPSYVTDGLIAYWDGIDNTGSGHDSSAAKWTDIVGGYELTLADTTKATWDADAISFNGTAGQGLYCDSFWTRPTNATIEVVLLPSASTTQVVATFDRSDTPVSGSTYDARRDILYADGTVGFVGKSGNTYTSPVSITAIRKMVAEYTDLTVNSCYVNGTTLSLSSKTHSFTFTGDPQIRIGVEKLGTSGNIYQFTGKVYAIRVYNRQLTSKELAKNLTYDNTRFNLGL